ncbi:TolC family protein [Bacteriovoracaceae bacterium]|nr:TolC family protein [Bacteriovoracaceae bacterium]
MKGIILSLYIFNLTYVFSKSFHELANRLNNHDLLTSNMNKVKAMQEGSKQAGSWGDPKLSISAMNYPQDSLSPNESMMTGIQFGLSQKLSLSGKHGKLKKFKQLKAKSFSEQSKQLKRDFLNQLWQICIEKEMIVGQIKVLKENLDWVNNNLIITKRLYSTGDVPQQAVLDVQIRKSELSSQINQNKYKLESLKYKTSALLSAENDLDVDMQTIPWEILDNWNHQKGIKDYRKSSLESNLKASQLNVSAQNRNYFPDITVGVSYTKRNDLDDIGDFVGASITIPLPTSDHRYASKNKAIFEKMEAEKKYRHYIKSKTNVLKKIEFEIKNTKIQLKILLDDSLRFAKSSREITAKSYSRGGADYLELLRAELQYQNLLIKQINLTAELKKQKVNYLSIQGGALLHKEEK